MNSFAQQTDAPEQSLYKQELSAQKALEKLFSAHSYQQICLQQSSQLNNLYTHFNRLKGDISRIYFFCESEYKIKLSRRQRRGFEIWDMKDPVSIFECSREKQHKKNKLDTNMYIINRC